MDHFIGKDRTEGDETVNSLTTDTPYLTEDMIDAAMNKHLNYQIMNDNICRMSTEEESLDSEEYWISKKHSIITKDSNCDINKTSEICNVKNGSENEVIKNKSNCKLFLKLHDVQNNNGSFKMDKVNVSGLDQNNSGAEKACRQIQENMQNDLTKSVKDISECTKSKELKTNDICNVNGSASGYSVDSKKEYNKSKNEVNCNGFVIAQDSTVCSSGNSCRPDCENMLPSESYENTPFCNISDDDSVGDDSFSMRLDDELKKAIENNLKKEIGSAFNLNSSGTVCSDVINKGQGISASVNINKKQCETITLCNSEKDNIECENKITVYGCESNSTFSKHLCSDKQQECVKIHVAEVTEIAPDSDINSSKISQVVKTVKLDNKSYFVNKRHQFETVTLSKNKFQNKSYFSVSSEKNISLQSSENSDVHEDFNEPSCSFRQINHAKSRRKEKTIANDVTEVSSSLSTPKVIVIKKSNLSEDNYKLCDNSQTLQGKNVKLLISTNIKNTSQNNLDKNTSSVVKKPFKVVPLQKTSAGVLQVPSNETLVETVFQRQIRVSQIPAYSTPGLDPAKAFKCDFCGDRFSVDFSLKHHLSRQSVEIIYWCRVCCLNIQFFNRCKMISHIKAHGQYIKNIDSSCVTVKPLPKHRIDLGLPKYAFAVNSTAELTTDVDKEQDKMKFQSNAFQAHNFNSQELKKNTVRGEKGLSTYVNNAECSKDKIDSNTQTPKAVVLTIPAYKLVPPKTGNIAEKSSVQKSKVVLLTKMPSKKMDDVCVVQRSENVQDSGPDTNIKSKICEYTSCQTLAQDKGNSAVTTAVNKNINEVKDSNIFDKQTNMKKYKYKGKGSYCNKCKCEFTDIVKHLNGRNSPANPEYTCTSCQLILPTKCALWFHMRIHTKIPPFKCPECAKDFSNFDLFNIHLKYICGHLSKIVTYVCSLCDMYYMNVSSLKTHIYNLHSVNIYKCNLCSYAFFSSNSLTSHKKQEHSNDRNVSFGSYRQCKMCPDRLVPRAKFTDHVNYHSRQSKHCTYQYKCDICQLIITGKEEFLTHQSKCLNNQHKKSIRESDREKGVEFVQSESIDTDCTVVEEEMMLNKDACSDTMVVSEKDPLSLEDWEDYEENIAEEIVETCVVCKEQQVIFVPGTDRNSQSLCCKQCVRPCFPSSDNMSESVEMVGGQINCDYNDDNDDDDDDNDIIEILSDEEKNIHEKTVRQKRKNDVQISSTKKQKFVNSVSLCQNGKESGVVSTQCQKLDFTKYKKHKTRKQGKHDVRGDGKFATFACGQVMAVTDNSSGWLCCKCQFTTDSVEDFHNHVILHRTDPDDFQCLECGLCFVVQPSLEKHLLFQHQIKDIKEYIAKNNVCDRIKQESDKTNENQCCVCYEIFDSKLRLDLHFRTHGMAFLSKNKRDTPC